MGAFATDQTLCQDDHRQLEAAATGDLESLVAVCRRFELPLLAAAMRTTVGVAAAFPLVEPTLSALCDELLTGRLVPEDWSRRALELLADQAAQLRAADDSPTDNGQPLSALGALPRMARRRAVREALPRLSLPELTALLLTYYHDTPPIEMVGLAGETEVTVRRFLEQARQKLNDVLVEAADAAADAD